MASESGLDTGSGADITGAVRGFLEVTADPWLLVLDGVTNHDHIADLLPTGGRGQVVVTAHAARRSAPAETITVGPFDSVDSGALLLALTRSERSRWRPSGVPNVWVGHRLRSALPPITPAATGLSFDEYLGALDDETSPASVALRRPRSLLEGAVLASVRAADGAAPGLAKALAAVVATTVDAPFPAAALSAAGADRGTAQRFGLVNEADGVVLVSPLVRDGTRPIGRWTAATWLATAADAIAEHLAMAPSDAGLMLLHAGALAGPGWRESARKDVVSARRRQQRRCARRHCRGQRHPGRQPWLGRRRTGQRRRSGPQSST